MYLGTCALNYFAVSRTPPLTKALLIAQARMQLSKLVLIMELHILGTCII